MNEDFWVTIKKSGYFYVVEKWQTGEERILFVEKRKRITLWWARRYAKKIILSYLSSQHIKEKLQ